LISRLDAKRTEDLDAKASEALEQAVNPDSKNDTERLKQTKKELDLRAWEETLKKGGSQLLQRILYKYKTDETNF
jgi:hypothetical protein